MRNFIKKAFTKTVEIRIGRGKTRQVKIPPNKTLIYGMYFAMVALIALTAVEIVHIVFIGSFSNEIFAAITLVIGTILGAFFGQKG